MYHHHSQQQGLQPFSNGSRPHHPPPPNQHQNRSSSDMLSQGMGFQFPRPTQLPDELESALAIRGPRDMDHRLIDHMSRPNQHQNQCSDPGISQRGNYSSDNPSGHQQEMDWSSYQPPTQLFAGPPPSASQQSQQHKGPQQKAPSSHAGTSIPNWTAPVSDSPSPQARHPLGGRSSGGVDGKGLYTPESAGSILASFGLSNEDLEVLSHYPDDQLTPDTLPFILRDIQINKSGNQIVASTSSFSRTIHDMSLPPPHSPEVPSLLTVTQTAGKVIDYGHASRANDKSNTRETFKREQLSNERTVKMYPSPSVPKADKGGRQQSHLEHTESSKHGDRDYRRASSDRRKNNRSPGREFPPSTKSRNLDRDYRRDELKPNLTSETRSNASSRRSLSSSSGSKPHGSSKKLPTPTMISDFSSVAPKVYPHTCSLCHILCDQEKDWVDHINTVNHTAACRDLRNKYPDWKPNLPSRSGHGSRVLWNPNDYSPSHSVSRSLSGSPTPSPPHSKRKPLGRPYPSHPLHQPSTEHGHQLESHHAGSLKNSSRQHRPGKRARESFGGPFHSAGKYPQNNSTKFSTDTSRRPSLSKANHNSKNSTLQPTKAVKSGTKPGTKSAKPPPAKKKKKVVSPASQDSSVADRLLYLTGIPKDASEQEVTDWVGSFGKINNVILMPCSEVASERDQGLKASVCMVRMEDAQSLANSANLSIRDQQITASIAKEPEAGQSLDANNSKPVPGPDKGAAEEHTGDEADVKTADQGMVLITGLPESKWSESDISALIEPFGTPSDIIMATQIGKVLVSVLNMDIAQELVKVNTSNPMKINDCELKMIHLKKCIRLSTPVALYNLLMGSEDPVESAVGWSSLLVISNVPNTPSAHSEVQKLVRRFGTVIKTVVINSMVICEMATAAMALSVYKRFNKFPCIIQNNPLYFSRKPDPKANTQNKVISTCIDTSEETPANAKGCQRDQEETAHTQESLLEGKEVDVDGKDKMTKSTHEIEVEALVKTDVLPNAVCGPLAEPDCKVPPETNMGETVPLETDMGETVPLETDTRETVHLDTDMGETVLDTDMKETVHLDTDMGATAADKTDVDTSKSEKDKSPAGEETKPSSSDGKATSKELVIPALRKVTQEMVNALLVECRTRVPSHPNNSAASTNKEVKETGLEAAQGREAAQAQEAARKRTEEEVKKKKDKERVRDREKRERDRRDRERRERERRERERRDRKRTHSQSVAGRLEGNKQRRDEHKKHSGAKTNNEVEEEFDEFPFNMSDFVTVDEVGDVTDLPSAASPTIPMETTKVGEDAPVCGQMDTTMDTPMEVPTDSSVSLVKSDDISECLAVPTPALVLTAAASQSDSNHSPTHVPSCQPDAPEIVGSALKASPDFADEVEPVPTCTSVPADSGPVKVKAEREDMAVTQLPEGMEQAEENRQLVQEQDRETEAPAADTGKHDGSKEQTHTDEDSVNKAVKKEPTMSTDCPLPPYNPSNPVGMEFLIPKTGFFCKVCNRFFSGFKEGEINHCKTLKHYTNVQKYLQTTEMANVTTKADLS